jgi:hypothetical protein
MDRLSISSAPPFRRRAFRRVETEIRWECQTPQPFLERAAKKWKPVFRVKRALADHGDKGPLERILRELGLTDYVDVKQPRRGAHCKDDEAGDLPQTPVQRAAREVRRIREIWKEYYPERKRRNVGPTAEYIAAYR